MTPLIRLSPSTALACNKDNSLIWTLSFFCHVLILHREFRTILCQLSYGMMMLCIGKEICSESTAPSKCVLFQDPSKVPAWLLVNKTVVPDFVVRDPKVCIE